MSSASKILRTNSAKVVQGQLSKKIILDTSQELEMLLTKPTIISLVDLSAVVITSDLADSWLAELAGLLCEPLRLVIS